MCTSARVPSVVRPRDVHPRPCTDVCRDALLQGRDAFYIVLGIFIVTVLGGALAYYMQWKKDVKAAQSMQARAIKQQMKKTFRKGAKLAMTVRNVKNTNESCLVASAMIKER